MRGGGALPPPFSFLFWSFVSVKKSPRQKAEASPHQAKAEETRKAEEENPGPETRKDTGRQASHRNPKTGKDKETPAAGTRTPPQPRRDPKRRTQARAARKRHRRRTQADREGQAQRTKPELPRQRKEKTTNHKPEPKRANNTTNTPKQSRRKQRARRTTPPRNYGDPTKQADARALLRGFDRFSPCVRRSFRRYTG